MNTKFNLGNPELNKKLVIYYSWIIPFIYLILGILFVSVKAWVASLIATSIFIITIPVLNETFKRKKISGMSKFLIVVTLTITMFYSTGIYL